MHSIPNQTQIQTKGETKLNKSESITNLAKALSQFQAEVQNPKNTANNPFFKSKYAPLNDVLNLVRPLLSKHGLSILQSPSGDGENIIISSILMHSTGEWIEPEPLVLRADKPTAQGAGSAITYGRRYSISAILGISSEDDDDGNHADDIKPKGQDKTKKDYNTRKIDRAMVDIINDLLKKTDSDIPGFLKYYKVAKIEDMTEQVFTKAVSTLQSKLKKQEVAK